MLNTMKRQILKKKKRNKPKTSQLKSFLSDSAAGVHIH